MSGHPCLIEQDRSIGIDSGCEQRRRHLDGVGVKYLRVDRDRQRMKIRQEEQGNIVGPHRILHRDPLFDRAEIIAEVEVARGLDAGDDAHIGSLSFNI